MFMCVWHHFMCLFVFPHICICICICISAHWLLRHLRYAPCLPPDVHVCHRSPHMDIGFYLFSPHMDIRFYLFSPHMDIGFYLFLPHMDIGLSGMPKINPKFEFWISYILPKISMFNIEFYIDLSFQLSVNFVS